MQNYSVPWEFHPQLTAERLSVIAEILLKVQEDTHDLLSSIDDDNYSRATCTFARQKNRIKRLCLSKKYSWLGLINPNNDYTITIGGIPIRSFTDDPTNPQRANFFRRNCVDQLFAPEDTIPTIWRFVAEKPEFEGEGGRVHFAGYNVLGEVLSLWTYGEERVAVLHSTDDTPPKPVKIELDDISASVPEKEKKSDNE
ncbi:hypothetical protein ABM011_15690 [Morganella morganii]|uniref:Uncharacterized protein n=1 Tax=Morganella morganii subsp. morganii KT TaxID=1124991 RepID=M1SML4_MORMO|nr:hypothetical protein [Morganella morganii]HDT0713263.1 hypothetical protein [Morganella morganii subsp. morganii]AGG31081.1 hypothetical protein MU9_2035 [Morganella morganii subsp. morganii KT]ELA8730253.1 hypothetical protein [Morganella morganii]MBC3967243.1 hypothetical protein [Morganella morganii]HCQ8177686.1 hypothetical protein [Morganella morganii]